MLWLAFWLIRGSPGLPALGQLGELHKAWVQVVVEALVMVVKAMLPVEPTRANGLHHFRKGLHLVHEIQKGFDRDNHMSRARPGRRELKVIEQVLIMHQCLS